MRCPEQRPAEEWWAVSSESTQWSYPSMWSTDPRPSYYCRPPGVKAEGWARRVTSSSTEP